MAKIIKRLHNPVVTISKDRHTALTKQAKKLKISISQLAEIKFKKAR